MTLERFQPGTVLYSSMLNNNFDYLAEQLAFIKRATSSETLEESKQAAKQAERAAQEAKQAAQESQNSTSRAEATTSRAEALARHAGETAQTATQTANSATARANEALSVSKEATKTAGRAVDRLQAAIDAATQGGGVSAAPVSVIADTTDRATLSVTRLGALYFLFFRINDPATAVKETETLIFNLDPGTLPATPSTFVNYPGTATSMVYVHFPANVVKWKPDRYSGDPRRPNPRPPTAFSCFMIEH